VLSLSIRIRTPTSITGKDKMTKVKALSNKNTALLMKKLMDYVIKHDYYPAEYFILLDIQQELANDDCTTTYFNNYVNTTLKAWSK
jgi:hypothetical protein